MKQALHILKKQVVLCRSTDQFRFNSRIRRISKQFSDKALHTLEADIQRSINIREQRKNNLPTPEYPPELPVSDRRDEILKTIKENQVVILCGETGSGKTTQIPKICLDAGRGVNGFIGLTQPRRLAARSVTSRLAEELKSESTVAYKIRFQDRTDKDTYIKVMTDGILLAEIQHDRFLNQYDTLIIDEAHERSLNIDFIIGYLKWLLPRRRDLKLIITSATIDPQRFSKHFNNAPIIEVSGRTYPVEIRYSPPVSDNEDKHNRDMMQSIIDAVDELKREAPGDILIFLSGEREIRETAEVLRKQQYRDTEVLPLYARLSSKEQSRIFRSHRGQRIILSTNVAETSLTVPGIKYVIDPGEVRISRYSWRSRVQRLPIEKISQASANQRSGRCGRTSDGIAIRLYSEEDYLNRPEFTDPEIQRTNLAAVILQMSTINLGDIENFPFVEAPDNRLIKDGFKLLFELHAVDEKYQLTKLGKQLGRLPIDPRLGRMLLAAEQLGALKEVLIIVSALSLQDPRERPMEKQQAADEKHSRFKDKTSDFLGYLKLWDYYHEQKKELSQNKLRKLCQKEFLSFMRLREWTDIHYQIRSSLKLRENTQEASEDAIHQSLLTGLLSHIGNKDDEQGFLGSHNRKFMIFPGSGLFKKPPKWVMAAEMVETTRLYARTVAKVQPQWIEQSASHLVKHHYSEPHWQKRSAQVGAYERLSLYGLTINPKKNINYGPIDPVISREIFIRHALVYGEYTTKAEYFTHNQGLIEELEELEAKSRRRDILIDEETLYDYYDKIIPEQIYNGRAFEKWRQTEERNNAKALFLTKDYLLQRDTDHVQSNEYPDHITLQDTTLPLNYHFEPGHQKDGITVRIPHILLNQINTENFDYLVPGMLEEKITAIIRALPKQIRKQFVPAPVYAKACAENMRHSQEKSLYEALNHHLLRMTGNTIPENIWQDLKLPDHLTMRYEICDEKGKVLKSARNLDTLRKTVKHKTSKNLKQTAKHTLEKSNLTQWNFEDLPEYVLLNTSGVSIRAYPALKDNKDSVAVNLFDTEAEAQQQHRKGLLRLFILNNGEVHRQLRQNLPNIQKLCLYYTSTGTCEELKNSIIKAIFIHTYLDQTIRSGKVFNALLEKNRSDLTTNTAELCRLLEPLLKAHFEIHKALKGNIKPNWLEALNDINDQLKHLVFNGFLEQTSIEELRHYPRYLKGMLRRLDKLAASAQRDRGLRIEVQPHWNQYKEKVKNNHTAYEQLQPYRWAIEEFRISLFAQELGTEHPISSKRLDKLWKSLK